MSNTNVHSNSGKKRPLSLRLIRWGYPKLEILAPNFATRLGIDWFLTPLRYPYPDPEKEIAFDARKSIIEISGQQVQIYEWGGSGPIILTVHGWSGRGTQFYKFIKPLIKKGYRVVSFDAPAHGRSTGKKTNVVEFCEVILSLHKKYKEIESIIAHSIGGVATLFALNKNLKLKKLALISMPSISDEIIKEYLLQINASSKLEATLKNYIFRKFNFEFDEVSGLKLAQKVDQIPTLIIHDTDDKEVKVINSEKLAKVMPWAKYVKTKELGHTRILRDGYVTQNVLSFLQEEN